MVAMEITVTQASPEQILLHITDAGASRWIKLTPAETEDLIEKLRHPNLPDDS